MNARKLTEGMLLGLAAGAITAYLTDPEFGKKRRAALAGEARNFFATLKSIFKNTGFRTQKVAEDEEAELLKAATT